MAIVGNLIPRAVEWRLHILVLDEGALPLLDGIDGRRCESGDPVDFDPEEFVIERLREWIVAGHYHSQTDVT